jgi:hypothetical protein
MNGANENPFWLGLWQLTQAELARHGSDVVPLDEQFIKALEGIAQKVEPQGDWYRVRGEDPKPIPADPPINFLIFGCLLGNFLAWRNGINFFHMLKEKH